jgi:putative flavoprotein involved in K+ transport
MKRDKFSTVVIGAGQAGLAAGYFLKKINEDFIILDEGNQTGDSWRNRWDSLKLFTPSQHDGLPGFRFSAIRGTMPTKEEMANYLLNYTNKFSLPVQTNTKVIELRKIADVYEIITSDENIYADNIIVATGTNYRSYIPTFATDLDKNIVQIHSSEYKNPESIPATNTLVVGAGTSGLEIAIELSKTRPTMLSGRPTLHIPDFALRYAGKPYWWFIHNILTINTPIGRKVRPKILNGGAPLISVSLEDVEKAQVEHLPRVKGVKNGLPQLEDGRVIPVTSIVWSTGYRPDFSWIKFDITDSIGWPKTNRGISEKFKGLYFVGMVFQYGLTSGLIGGVGRDAAFVVNHLYKINSTTYHSSRSAA